jgi:hypothetical protein
MFTRIISVFVILLTVAGAPASAASILYGVVDSTDQLITIDPTTGAGSVVGSFQLLDAGNEMHSVCFSEGAI